jgi:hypothetical protein
VVETVITRYGCGESGWAVRVHGACSCRVFQHKFFDLSTGVFPGEAPQESELSVFGESTQIVRGKGGVGLAHTQAPVDGLLDEWHGGMMTRG